MNLPGRNLLSLTVYHLRRLVKLIVKPPVAPGTGGVSPGDGGGTVVSGGGANPGDSVEVTLPGGETGTGEAGGDGNWQVEFPDVPYDPNLDPGDIGVITTPKPGEPVIDDIKQNADGSVTVGGSGANPGDQITVTFPDGSTGTGTAGEDGNWSVTSPSAQSPDLQPGDLVVVAVPDPILGSITAPDAVYADSDGYEYVEVSDDGLYVAWEQLIEAAKRIVGVSSTASPEISFDGVYGLAKRVVKHGEYYIAAFDSVYLIFRDVMELSAGTARVVTKRYITSKKCDVFKTEHSAYYFRADNGVDRLARFDGVDTSIALDIKGAFGDSRLPTMVSLGDKDWLVNADFSISYLIDPQTLQVTPGPVLNVEMQIFGSGSEVVSNNGVVYACCKRADSTVVVMRIDESGYTEVTHGNGKLVVGDKYLYKLGGDAKRVDLSTLDVQSMTAGMTFITGYAEGDFAVFMDGAESVKVTYDAGATFERLFYVENDSSLWWIDVEARSLVLTRNYRTYDLLEYKLIEE